MLYKYFEASDWPTGFPEFLGEVDNSDAEATKLCGTFQRTTNQHVNPVAHKCFFASC